MKEIIHRAESATEVRVTNVDAILHHHSEAMLHGRKCREHMVAAGRLLSQQKQVVGHGKWIRWIEDNLPFPRRTAAAYVSVYAESEEGKWETASHLMLESSESKGTQPMTHEEAES